MTILALVGSSLVDVGPLAASAGVPARGFAMEPDALRLAARDGVTVAIVPGDAAGLEFCHRLKTNVNGLRVLLSADSCDPPLVQAGLAALADGFLDGSTTPEELSEAVNRVSAGHAWVPPHLLGTLLRTFVRLRREEDEVLQRFASLTPREREVLGLLAGGASAAVIARKFVVSQHTARTHVQRILQKMGVHSRGEAAELAIRHGLVERFGLSDGAERSLA